MTPQTQLEKTLAMKLQNTYYRLNEFIASLRLDARWLGPRTGKYLLSNADALETLLKEIQKENEGIWYEEVD